LTNILTHSEIVQDMPTVTWANQMYLIKLINNVKMPVALT